MCPFGNISRERLCRGKLSLRPLGLQLDKKKKLEKKYLNAGPFLAVLCPMRITLSRLASFGPASSAPYCPKCASSSTEYSGCFSLMICENGIPLSSPVINVGHLRLSALCIGSLGRDTVALVRQIPAVLRERVAVSEEITAVLQKEMFNECASMVSQCRLKSSLFFNFVSGQSRHLISLIALGSQPVSSYLCSPF